MRKRTIFIIVGAIVIGVAVILAVLIPILVIKKSKSDSQKALKNLIFSSSSSYVPPCECGKCPNLCTALDQFLNYKFSAAVEYPDDVTGLYINKTGPSEYQIITEYRRGCSAKVEVFGDPSELSENLIELSRMDGIIVQIERNGCLFTYRRYNPQGVDSYDMNIDDSQTTCTM